MIDIFDSNLKVGLRNLIVKAPCYQDQVFDLLKHQNPLASAVATNIDTVTASDLLFIWMCEELNPKNDKDKVIDIEDICKWIAKKSKIFKALDIDKI